MSNPQTYREKGLNCARAADDYRCHIGHAYTEDLITVGT